MKNPCLALLLFFSAFLQQSFSQTGGILDATFSTDGKVITSFPGLSDVFALAIQPDQKIVAAGHVRKNNSYDFALARYQPDGSLDNSFGTDGKRFVHFGYGDDYGKSVLLQADGKIIVTGYASNGAHSDFALARLLENGDLDTTFGVQGLQTVAIGPGASEGWSAALQADGKIVMAGTAYLNATQSLIALARFTSEGTLDSLFGIAGIITTALDSLNDHAQAVAIQTDGKIVVAGYGRFGAYTDFALLRYQINGALDTAFGAQGKLLTDFTGFNDYGYAMTLQPDGKIVVAGTTTSGTSLQSFALARYEANGILDNTFGVNGKTKININNLLVPNIAQAVTLQSDGKIVAAGYCYIPGYATLNFALARFHTDGNLDLDFNGTGMVSTPLQVGNDQARAVAVQADGKIVAAGRSASSDFALARYLSGQSVDVTDAPFFGYAVRLYPNPVAETALVEYSLQQAETVSILLYDQLGHIITRLADHLPQTAGPHVQSLELPASLPAGIYYLALTTPGRRIVLPIEKRHHK